MKIWIYILLIISTLTIKGIAGGSIAIKGNSGGDKLCPRASGTIPSMCHSECTSDEDCIPDHGDDAVCCHGGCKKENPENKNTNVTYMSCLPAAVCRPGICKHGDCYPDIGESYICICDGGFKGTNCDIDINECESSPCLNGGTCIDLVANYSCCCPSGLTGRHCEKAILPECRKLLTGKPAFHPCLNCKKYKDAVCITKTEFFLYTADGEKINVTDECMNP